MFSYNYSLPKELKEYMHQSINESIKKMKAKKYDGSLEYPDKPYSFLPIVSLFSFLIGYKIGKLTK